MTSLSKFIINKFSKREEISWPRDFKILKKVTENYPNKEFWEWLPKEEWMYSVVYFATFSGKQYLSDKFFEFLKKKKRENEQVFKKNSKYVEEI